MTPNQFMTMKNKHGFYKAYKAAKSKIKFHNYSDNLRPWCDDDVTVMYDHEEDVPSPEIMCRACLIANYQIRLMIRHEQSIID